MNSTILASQLWSQKKLDETCANSVEQFSQHEYKEGFCLTSMITRVVSKSVTQVVGVIHSSLHDASEKLWDTHTFFCSHLYMY